MHLLWDCVGVRCGDSIEYDPQERLSDEDENAFATESRSFVAARVMDVDSSLPTSCVVQLSPFEPLQTLDLREHFFKIVYAVGEMTQLSNDMIGWVIELSNDTPASTQRNEPATIKRIDPSINCALLVFENGKKDWTDLMITSFKVHGHYRRSHKFSLPDQESKALSTKPMESDSVVSIIPRLDVPSRQHNEINMLQQTTDASKPDIGDFDWYAEGGHVELCDAQGAFLQGAILCSRVANGILQLYNEQHQFFQVDSASQSLKVVIHGLLSLKYIPMGQPIEVYSAMTGGFRRGIVLKAADVGKLTPIRFTDGHGESVEWLDLSSQTFKLCFLGTTPHPSPTRTTVASLELTVLPIGQWIEIFDPQIRHYLKYKVTTVHDSTVPVHYDVERVMKSSIPSVLGPKSIQNVTLSNLRCRIPIQPSHWDVFQPILLGHRVDVNDKVGKTVETGEVVSVHPTLKQFTVRYASDHRQETIDVANVKSKLRLYGNNSNLYESGEVTTPVRVSPVKKKKHHEKKEVLRSDAVTEDSNEALFFPVPMANETPSPPTSLSPLLRRQSDSSVETNNGVFPPLVHASTIQNLLQEKDSDKPESTTSEEQHHITPLNFSQLTRSLPTEQEHLPPATALVNVPVEETTTLLLEEIWTEQVDEATKMTIYVNMATGIQQTTMPEWIQRVDPVTNTKSLLHTNTYTVYPLPNSSRTTTPRSGGRLVLPVGAIEAVRVVNR